VLDVPTDNNMNDETQKFIAKRHNQLRAGVSPTPANMLKTYWSEKLAELATENANSCSFSHDNFPDLAARADMGIMIGQNLAYGYDNWEQAIKGAWYDEIEDFEYGVGKVSGWTIGHFVMVTLAKSSLVGCAYADCPDSRYGTYFVCNYAFVPDGQTETPRPWKDGAGAACTECTKGTCDGNLCDIGPNIIFDAEDCSAPDGDSCRWWDEEKCYVYTNMAPQCHHKCGLCPT